MTPSLTVLIPNFNHGHLIGDQLNAVFSQSIQPQEIIIADDASTDDSVITIKKLISGRTNVRLIPQEKNMGTVALINDLVNQAKSDYLTVLAADDIILPGLFEKSLALLSSNPEAALCSAVSYTEHSKGDYVTPTWTAYPCSAPGFMTPDQIRRALLRSEDWFMGDTVVWRRAALMNVGGFDTRLLSYADGFMYRVLALRHGACFIPEILAINRAFDSGYSTATTRDVAKLEQILLVSNAQMRETYRDLFPPELLTRSNARMLFRLISERLNGFETSAQSTVDALYFRSGHSRYVLMVRIAIRILKAFSFCFLRTFDVPRVLVSRLWPKPLPHITRAMRP